MNRAVGRPTSMPRSVTSLLGLTPKDPLDRPLVFVTGAPRSGTSMVTKIIDAHPDVAVLMENIFGNRRRTWSRKRFWNSERTLRRAVAATFSKLEEPIVGNKVCTPEAWSAEDIVAFCHLFAEFRIVFVIRSPIDMCVSRYERSFDIYQKIYSPEARCRMLLDFRSPFHTYVSSWRQAVETSRRLRDAYADRVHLVYYEDLCEDFDAQAAELFDFLGIPWDEQVSRWHALPHHTAAGELKKDLKYKDEPARRKERPQTAGQWPDGMAEAVRTIDREIQLWEQRAL